MHTLLNACIRTTHHIQYIPRNMHTVFALLCFVVVIHWLIFPYPSGLLHWHCGNLKIAPVPAKQPWWIWINTSCELIMNDCITTTKQSTTKPCAYFLGYTVAHSCLRHNVITNTKTQGGDLFDNLQTQSHKSTKSCDKSNIAWWVHVWKPSLRPHGRYHSDAGRHNNFEQT